MTANYLTPLAASLPSTVPFVGPETQERARGEIFNARLGANENVFGPSPAATRALSHATHWMYGDPENHELRTALADHLKLKCEQITVGEGIDGLLGYLVRLTVGPGDSVVTSDGAYPTFNYHVTGFGGQIHKVPYKKDHEDPSALFKKAAEVGAKLVYLSNPDNPMGSWLEGAALLDQMQALPTGTLLVLDEAYIECAPASAHLPLSFEDPRVIRLRTFSKAYGLAGARIGYALGAADLISAFNRVRNHFGVSRASQAAALAALLDQHWLRSVVGRIVASRLQIKEIARKHGLTCLPSAANFVAIDCGQDGAYATRVLQGLVDRGVFARMPQTAPLDRCVRISCGTPADLEIFSSALPSALQTAEKG
ncbi:MAG: pyridoxal phosphate-dependent aminotransferase [Pseudomonadota bacterium]